MNLPLVLDYAGLALIFLGMIIILIAIVLLAMEAKGKTDVKGGGVILIGPFPIVFGTSEKIVKLMLIVAIVLIIIVVGMMLLPRLVG